MQLMLRKEKRMTDTTIVKTVIFAASRETVWEFLTQKEKLAIWFHPAEEDLSLNKDYALLDTNADGEIERVCWGSVLEMEHPSKLTYTFTVKPLNGHMTTVSWKLEETHGGTKLTLTHKGFEGAGDNLIGLFMALDAGWDKHFAKFREAMTA